MPLGSRLDTTRFALRGLHCFGRECTSRCFAFCFQLSRSCDMKWRCELEGRQGCCRHLLWSLVEHRPGPTLDLALFADSGAAATTRIGSREYLPPGLLLAEALAGSARIFHCFSFRVGSSHFECGCSAGGWYQLSC